MSLNKAHIRSVVRWYELLGVLTHVATHCVDAGSCLLLVRLGEVQCKDGSFSAGTVRPNMKALE